MITSTHLLIGAAIGKATGSLYITIPLAFLSHYLLDIIPHYNPGPVKAYLERGFCGADKKDLFLKSIEPIIGVAIVVYAAYLQSEISSIIIIGAFAGWLPDVLVFIEWRFNNNSGIIRKIEKSYHHHASFLIGIIPQLIISALAFLYIFS